MNKDILLPIMLIAVLIVSGCVIDEDTEFFSKAKEDACINSGGTVTTQLCCKSSSDFPNTCLIGACGCAADQSHEVKFCDCGEGKCWDNEKGCTTP